MKTKQTAEKVEMVIPALGAPFEGGFFAGEFVLNEERYALVVASKAEGENLNLPWKKGIKFCQTLNIGGFDDWYLPSRDELAMLQRNLGPRRQDTPELFREGAAEDFETDWYWSSTEHASSSYLAWIVFFSYGYQNYYHKLSTNGVRAVRRLKI